MEFYSHPDKLLSEHLLEVGKVAERFTRNSGIENGEFYAQIAYLIGTSHDFGKYTTFFQDRLFKKKDWGRKSDHSFISSLFTAWLIRNWLQKQNISDNCTSYFPLVTYLIILNHHGDLSSLERIPSTKDLRNPPSFPYAKQDLRDKLSAAYEQLESIRNNKPGIARELRGLLGEDIDLEVFFNTWLNELSELSKLRYSFLNNTSDEYKKKVLMSCLLLYSSLIDADKRDAAEVAKVRRKNLASDMVDRFKETHFSSASASPMDMMRNEIYDKVTRNVMRVSLKDHLFTITAPTGSGKTLAAFSCALKLREKVERELGYSPRIIYSLPFISVIEQNYDAIREVLQKNLNDFEANESSYLLKHHHLADLTYKAENEKRPLDEALLLTEGQVPGFL